jgi:hypothetical protein
MCCTGPRQESDAIYTLEKSPARQFRRKPDEGQNSRVKPRYFKQLLQASQGFDLVNFSLCPEPPLPRRPWQSLPCRPSSSGELA